jgi:large subunit ribosomal protein L6
MSRIGKQPVPIPDKVKVELGDSELRISGPKGNLTSPIPEGIRCEQKENEIVFTRDSASSRIRAFHGLARALAANAVKGVSVGFTKELDIVGVGYRAELKGKSVIFNLGFSHPIEFPIPEGIEVKVDKQTRISVSGADRQQVGQVASVIRGLKKPDPYKNKGIRYVGEVLRKKAGKAAAGAGGAG